jgi:probable F420-dependent oxidoreductase
MRIGTGPPHGARRSRATLQRYAVASEELGYDSIWVSEHVVVPIDVESPYPYSADGKVYWDHRAPWLHASVALAFIAAVTERVKLGTTIIPVMSRNPLALAKEAATIDLLSDGRLELGIGAGWCREEATMLGIASDHPIGRLEETIDILRAAWGKETFEYHGRFFDFDEVAVHPQPVQGADVPIFIGGQSPRLLRIASEKAQGSIISQRTNMLTEVRAALGPGKLVSVPLSLTADFDPEEVMTRALGFREQGATHLTVSSRDAEIDEFVGILERFSARVMPDLRAAATDEPFAAA